MSKRKSSSSRKDGGSHRRRSSSSRKEGGESRGVPDGERSLPRKYSRQNSGESLSHARKNSRSSHTRTSHSQGHSSKDDQGTEEDLKGEEGMVGDSKRDGEASARISGEVWETRNMNANFTVS